MTAGWGTGRHQEKWGKSTMTYFINELVGTFILVLLGDGVCCNISLEGSGQKGGNTTHCAIGWGLAVLVPAFIFGASTGAHFNPSVTIAMAVNGSLSWSLVPLYIAGQLIGGFLGAALLIVMYHDQLAATKDNATKRGCFCTAPSMRNTALNALSEIVCTFVLVFAILGIGTTVAGDYALNYIFVFGIITAIGMSFGGLTGYSMNAARDTAPRLAFALLCPGENKDADWGYAWIPSICPIIGGIIAVLLYNALPM